MAKLGIEPRLPEVLFQLNYLAMGKSICGVGITSLCHFEFRPLD